MGKEPQIPDEKRHEILRVLVGSRAHGLNTPESDYDYRAVFTVDAEDLLSLWAPATFKGWVEGEGVDSTSYELRHFLEQSLHCNPSMLEIFRAPVMDAHGEFCMLEEKASVGNALRDLFPYIWTPDKVAAAFGGYSHNQMKKFLDPATSEERKWKFAVAYIRVLLQGIELLSTGSFDLGVPEGGYPKVPGKAAGQHMGMANLRMGHGPWSEFLRKVKTGVHSTGMIMDVAKDLNATMEELAVNGPFKDHQQGEAKVNEFLLRVRRDSWTS